MRLSIKTSPDIAEAMRREVLAGEKATTRAMAKVGTDLKLAWRRQINGAGLGTRLANSVRSATYPKSGESLRAAALVWSKAPKIVSAHDQGTTIRSKNGFYLAIPTEAAGRAAGGRRMSPGEWERRRGIRLRFVYRRGAPSLLVADKARMNKKGLAVVSKSKTGRNQVTAPIFILVPQVRLRKRLDLERDTDRAISSVPSAIVAQWVEDRTK